MTIHFVQNTSLHPIQSSLVSVYAQSHRHRHMALCPALRFSFTESIISVYSDTLKGTIKQINSQMSTIFTHLFI